MSDAFDLLWLPFVVSLCLVGIHAYLGLQVLARNIVFVDLALAQIAALGATVAFMLGHSVNSAGSYAYSAGFALLAAMLLAATRGWSGRVSQEALIGVIYVVAAAAAFLLVEKAPQGTEHIKQLLTGNILTTGLDDLKTVVPMYIVVGALLWAMRARLANPGNGWHAWAWDFLFYACFGLVVTSSVALAGVLLVFSFLIIPAAIGLLYANTLGRQLAVGWIVGTIASLVGLGVSYRFDLPTGSAMVCVFGAALALAGALRPVIKGGSRQWGTLTRRTRFAAALVFAASALWIAVAPRSDQPLLDSAEYFVPGMRALYMRELEKNIYHDAELHSRRYARDAETLNEREAASRWQGAALDDHEVRRISSFLQSYGEMRKGEEFVKREVQNLARERNRWALAAAMLALGAFCMPWRPKPAAAG